MKKHFVRLFLYTTAISIILSSCNRKAQLLYVNNIGNENLKTQAIPIYTLKPGDVLYIQILTQDPNISNLFNNKGIGSAASATNMFMNDASQYLYGYSVSDSGYVQLPVLGNIKVSGLSINQATESIQKSTSKYLTDGIAVVKLLSYKITVLGEVKRPGVFTNFKDNLTIFEGLGFAGDLTDYAERTNVLLMRQTPDGVKTIRLNLQDKNILFSEAYYLVPNDMVVVEPRKGKLFSMNQPNVSLYLSIISTTLLLMNFIIK